MFRCFVWGMGSEYERSYNLLKYGELTKDINILGIISKDKWVNYLDGKQVCDKDVLLTEKWDYLIVCAAEENYKQILTEIDELEIDRGKVIKGDKLFIPGFEWKKYDEIIKKKITLISDDCWGGVLLNYIGVQFNTPFINTYIDNNDYLILLENFEEFLASEIYCLEEGEPLAQRTPVGGIKIANHECKIVFPHYWSYVHAEQDWNRRKKRINSKNLFIKMTIQQYDEDTHRRFEKLPFENKVCFNPITRNKKIDISFPKYNYECKNRKLFVNPEFRYYTLKMQNTFSNINVFKMLCGDKELRMLEKGYYNGNE